MHCRIIYAIKNPSPVPKTPSVHSFGLLRAIRGSVDINALRAQLLLGLIDLLHHDSPSANQGSLERLGPERYVDGRADDAP